MAGMLSNTRWSMLRAAKAGDADSLRSLCTKYRPVVLGYLKRRGLQDEAEDVAQEVLLGLVEALPRVDPSAGRFRALVFAVASNKLAEHFRRRGAQKRGGGATLLVADPDVFAGEREPEDLFDWEWIEALVQRCLGRLRDEHPDQYGALKAFVLDGRPQVDIAAELGVEPPTIRKRVWRGKRNVASYLRDEVESYEFSQSAVEDELRFLNGLLGPLGSSE